MSRCYVSDCAIARCEAARGRWCLSGRLVAAMLAGLWLLAAPAGAADRHAGYYYPTPTSTETYVARAQPLADSDRRRRILFTTEVTAQMLARPYPPPYAIFAKGAEAEKLIITAVHADWFGTLYRMRGLLAQMTAVARTTPMFRSYEVDDLFTFLDLLKLLGFRRLTVTDGDSYAHQFIIE